MRPVTCFLIVGAIALSGCLASVPGSSPPVYQNPPAATSAPPSLPSVNPNVITGLPQPTFSSPYTADQISPILYGNSDRFILLGAASQGNWVHPSQVYGLLFDDRAYDFYSDTKLVGSAMAHVKTTQSQGPPGTCEYYDVDQSLKGDEAPLFGFNQGQAVVLRQADEIPTDTTLYQQYVSDWLALQDVSNPVVKITRILRVDLEGDGADEILISASHFAEETGHMVSAGDYSLIIMRKIVGNDVHTVPLISDIYRGDTPVLRYPPTYLLDHVFDLNGDGKLEVIVRGTWWEGSGLYVYEIHGIDATQVLKVSCGLVSQN